MSEFRLLLDMYACLTLLSVGLLMFVSGVCYDQGVGAAVVGVVAMSFGNGGIVWGLLHD